MRLRGNYVGLEGRKRWEADFEAVDRVVFSAQLNKVLAVLTEGSDEVHLSLLRIYLSRGEAESARFSGAEMLVNLYRYYVSSFREIEDLFKEGKHPLFRLLRNHMALLFGPTLRRFHEGVGRVAAKCGGEGGVFYVEGEAVLETELRTFVRELPADLLKLLGELRV